VEPTLTVGFSDDGSLLGAKEAENKDKEGTVFRRLDTGNRGVLG
jgi:hypothetical protein